MNKTIISKVAVVAAAVGEVSGKLDSLNREALNQELGVALDSTRSKGDRAFFAFSAVGGVAATAVTTITTKGAWALSHHLMKRDTHDRDVMSK